MLIVVDNKALVSWNARAGHRFGNRFWKCRSRTQISHRRYIRFYSQTSGREKLQDERIGVDDGTL